MRPGQYCPLFDPLPGSPSPHLNSAIAIHRIVQDYCTELCVMNQHKALDPEQSKLLVRSIAKLYDLDTDSAEELGSELDKVFGKTADAPPRAKKRETEPRKPRILPVRYDSVLPAHGLLICQYRIHFVPPILFCNFQRPSSDAILIVIS